MKNVTLDSLKKMNYLRYTISEILRIGTPVPFLVMREAIQDHTIGGIKIEKGTYVDV
jgi:cytochrome P450